jgi:hypothetical protein
MYKIYEVDPKKSLHDIMFDAWEQHPIVFINGIPHRTLLLTLAYDFENDIGPHSTQGRTTFSIILSLIKRNGGITFTNKKVPRNLIRGTITYLLKFLIVLTLVSSLSTG